MSGDEAINTGLTLDEVIKRYPLRRKDPKDPGARVVSKFWINGENLDQAACTAAVGVEPTQFLEQRVRGRFMPSGRPNILPPSWSLKVVHEPTVDVGECLGELLSMLWPRCKEIKALLGCSRYSAGFNTHVIVFEYAPICELTPVTLSRLAEFGLNWGFSWQDVTPTDEPDGAANRNQPVGSEGDQTSSAAGPGS
jgi:hypothetical protein